MRAPNSTARLCSHRAWASLRPGSGRTGGRAAGRYRRRALPRRARRPAVSVARTRTCSASTTSGTPDRQSVSGAKSHGSRRNTSVTAESGSRRRAWASVLKGRKRTWAARPRAAAAARRYSSKGSPVPDNANWRGSGGPPAKLLTTRRASRKFIAARRESRGSRGTTSGAPDPRRQWGFRIHSRAPA